MKLKNASIGDLWSFQKESKTTKVSDNKYNVLPCYARQLESSLQENIILALTAILVVMVILLSAYAMFAQEKPSAKGVQIRQKVPGVRIFKIINYKSSTAMLFDFEGELLILNFWATWCKGCLELIPEPAALQKRFGDQLQILYVTSQSAPGIPTLREPFVRAPC